MGAGASAPAPCASTWSMAANALGYASNWLTEWFAFDQERVTTLLGRWQMVRAGRRLHSHRHPEDAPGRTATAGAFRNIVTFSRESEDHVLRDQGANAHGLPHDPFKAIVSPRPIGWIGSKGMPTAPSIWHLTPISTRFRTTRRWSCFPPSGRKDTLRNVEETGVFHDQHGRTRT
jgi:hypothetical protein